MAETRNFPNGYEVTVYKKQDILDCIDANIIDKEIALAIVEQCEIAAANVIREGRWAGIPFMGSIRVKPTLAAEATSEQQLLIQAARENLDKDKYVMFRQQLRIENVKQLERERYYKYITSIAVNRNKKLYRKLCKERGEYYARIFLYASKSITALDNEYVFINDDTSVNPNE